MQSEENRSVEAQLSEHSIVRAEAIDAWVALALEQEDPGEWINSLVSAALEKLDTVPENLSVKTEARKQLLHFSRAVHSDLAQSRLTRRRSGFAGEVRRPKRGGLIVAPP